MTENLLKQMISIVDGTMESYKSDFYTHDLRSLVSLEDNAKFFWLCDKGHTALAIIDMDYLWNILKNSEGDRFYAMQDKDNLLGSLTYWMRSGDKKCYYYDGEHLNGGINLNYVYDIWDKLFETLKFKIKQEFPAESEYYHRGQRIEFASPQIRQEFLGVLRETDSKESLLNTVRAMRYYARRAVNERIVIGYDHAPRCFSFYQERNGEVVFNGGIIYYEEREHYPEHWCTHT